MRFRDILAGFQRRHEPQICDINLLVVMTGIHSRGTVGRGGLCPGVQALLQPTSARLVSTRTCPSPNFCVSRRGGGDVIFDGGLVMRCFRSLAKDEVIGQMVSSDTSDRPMLLLRH